MVRFDANEHWQAPPATLPPHVVHVPPCGPRSAAVNGAYVPGRAPLSRCQDADRRANPEVGARVADPIHFVGSHMPSRHPAGAIRCPGWWRRRRLGVPAS